MILCTGRGGVLCFLKVLVAVLVCVDPNPGLLIVDCKRVGHASRGADDTSNFGANTAKELVALTASTSVDGSAS